MTDIIDTDDSLEEDIDSLSGGDDSRFEVGASPGQYAPEMLRRIVEGALLAAGRPLNLENLQGLFEDNSKPTRDELRQALRQIGEACQYRGFELVEVASGWRFQVCQDLSNWVCRLWEEKPQRYSRAMLETLALIAYRQPITRGDIEEIRGVAVSSQIMKTLQERGWIRVVGHRDVPGRPAMYATTREFLDYFNLKSLDELPTLAELRDLDAANQTLDLGLPGIEPVPVTALPVADQDPADETDTDDEGRLANDAQDLFAEPARSGPETPDTDEEHA